MSLMPAFVAVRVAGFKFCRQRRLILSKVSGAQASLAHAIIAIRCRKLVCTEPRAHEFSYGDSAKSMVAVSIKCEAETVEAWEANDGIVHLPEAAGAR